MGLNWLALGSQRGEDPRNYLDDIYRYSALRIGRHEDAEDIAIEVVQSLPNPCHKRDLRLYMLGMARRKVADWYRSQRPTTTLLEADRAIRFDHQSDQVTLVRQVMTGLNDDHREVLTLKYTFGMTSAEIGGVMDRSPEAIDSLLQRARAAFEADWTALTSETVKP